MSTVLRTLQSRRGVTDGLARLYEYRELLQNWTLREIKSRYRQSVLGFGWAIVQPVFQMVVISIIFGSFLHVPSGNVPYPVFAYVALLPWTFFSGAINTAVPSLLTNMDLVTKIYFPREVLPLSSIVARLADLVVASVVFVGMMAWYRLPIHFTLIFVPVLILILLLLAIGVGLLGAAVSVFLRDISFAVPLGMQLWMYASPVIYPITQVPERWRWLYMLNPMAGIIDSFRRVVLDGLWPDPFYLGLAGGVSFVLCIIAYANFKRLEMAMSDII